MLTVERLGRLLGRRGVDDFEPAQVFALGPRNVNTSASPDDNVLHLAIFVGRERTYGLVDRLLE